VIDLHTRAARGSLPLHTLNPTPSSMADEEVDTENANKKRELELLTEQFSAMMKTHVQLKEQLERMTQQAGQATAEEDGSADDELASSHAAGKRNRYRSLGGAAEGDDSDSEDMERPIYRSTAPPRQGEVHKQPPLVHPSTSLREARVALQALVESRAADAAIEVQLDKLQQLLSAL